METNLAFQEDVLYEMIGGKLVAMSPTPAINHSRVSGNIFNIFSNYLKGKSCVPFHEAVKVVLSESERYIPDVMIICDRSKIKGDAVYGAPDLVVEVRSPGTAKRDRGHKMQAYEKYGVREYWLVSPGDRAVEVYLLQDGKFQLDNIYSVYYKYELIDLTEQEREAVVTEFKCSLYDDLVIRLEDVFYDLIGFGEDA